MNWIERHNQEDEYVNIGGCRNNGLHFADDLVLLASSEQRLQHALDRFAISVPPIRKKISTKKTEVSCLSRKLSQWTLQMCDIAEQQIEKFKNLGLAFTSDPKWNREIDIPFSIKQTQFCVSFIALWSQNGHFRPPHGC